MKDSGSYQSVMIDGIEQNTIIINSDNLNEKTILSLPGEDIKCGAYVEWMNQHWLVSEVDANKTVYTKAKMLQCNYLLRWVDDDRTICDQWCIVEDGTKYLIGTYEDRYFFTDRGDSRISLMLARNERTSRMGRERRFLIDDPNSNTVIAYKLTKPLKIGHTYDEGGVYSFVLTETPTTDDDNQELRIADYYKIFPREIKDESEKQNKGGWL